MRRQFKLWVLTFAAAGMTLSAAAQAQEVAQDVTMGDVVKKYEEAATLLNDKQFTAAIPLLEETVTLGQTVGGDALDVVGNVQKLLVEAYYNKGVMALGEKKFNTALGAFEKAEELADLYENPQIKINALKASVSVLTNQGIQYFNEKSFADALERFAKGLEKEPTNAKLIYFQARCQAQLGEFDQAVALFRQVIEAGETDPAYAADAKNARTELNKEVLGKAVEAAKAGNMDKLTSLVEIIPENPNARLLVIQAANNKKLYDRVIAEGQTAYELQPDEAKKSTVAYLIGVAFQNKGNNAKSAEWLRKVTAGGNVSAAKTLLAEVQKP